MRSLLFLCTGNSCRSQMAEGFARALAPRGVRVQSAGTRPAGLNPTAVEVMAEVGIDISGQRSKDLAALDLGEVDALVTLCGEAAESCPALPRAVERRHWPLRDPARARGEREEVLAAFREVRDAIAGRVRELFAQGAAAAPRAPRGAS